MAVTYQIGDIVQIRADNGRPMDAIVREVHPASLFVRVVLTGEEKPVPLHRVFGSGVIRPSVRRSPGSPAPKGREPSYIRRARKIQTPDGPARDAEYLAFIAEQTCCVYGCPSVFDDAPVEATIPPGSDDYLAVPLCRSHRADHDEGATVLPIDVAWMVRGRLMQTFLRRERGT